MTELWSSYVTEEPEDVEEMELKYNVIQSTFENKKKQFSLKSTTPEQSWRLKWGVMDEADVNTIWLFYVARNGQYESFYWYHPYEKTTLSEAGGSQTHIHVTDNLRVMAGDTVMVDGTAYTVASVDMTAKTITLTGTCNKASGSVVQIRYTVRFGDSLTLNNLTSWLYSLGLLFVRDI